MASTTLLNKTMYNISATDYAKSVNEIAKRSKKFAMGLPDMGIRGNCSQQDIITLVNNDLPGMYDPKTGNLTQKGIKEMIGSIRHMFKLDSDEAAKTIKVEDVINETVKNYEFPAKLDIVG